MSTQASPKEAYDKYDKSCWGPEHGPHATGESGLNKSCAFCGLILSPLKVFCKLCISESSEGETPINGQFEAVLWVVV